MVYKKTKDPNDVQPHDKVQGCEEANKSRNHKISISFTLEHIYKMCLVFDETINPSRTLEEVHA